MRWGLPLGIGIVVNGIAFVACDQVERDPPARFYVAPDADDDTRIVVANDASPVLDAGEDATTDGGDAGDAATEAGPVGQVLATGSGAHPDLTVGTGDHTCVIAAGGAATVWCWGANDHGQLGLGTTGDGTVVADVVTATRIAIDETGIPFEGVEELALAPWHSCARAKDVLFCWGQRFSGAQAEPPSALGPDRTRPRAIGNLDVTRIAAGGPHTCAAKANGKHVCFGHSTFNELGRANADDLACTAPIFYPYHAEPTHKCSGLLVEAPVTLPKLSAVAAGEVHSCALAGDRASCWGTNLGGQLGRPGTQVGELNPQEVVTDPALLSPLDGLSAIAAGGKHTCALRQGIVYCWGTNDADQLGVPTGALPQRAYAAVVAGLTNVESMGVAERVSCAVKTDKTLWCWGTDITSLVGGGAVVSTAVPTQVKGPAGVGVLTDVAAVAPGLRHVCAQKTDKTVWCWGKNDRGQLGDGTKLDSAFPVKVTGLP